jgi:hypothetical protein
MPPTTEIIRILTHRDGFSNKNVLDHDLWDTAQKIKKILLDL